MRPDNDYLQKLGLANYWFQYVEWEAIYAIHDTTGEDLSVMSGDNPGIISQKLVNAWKDDPTLAPLAKRYKKLAKKRNHLVHSHPATHPTHGQRLYRHDIKAKNRPKTTMWIESAWLDKFVWLAEQLNNDIHQARMNI